MNSLYPILQSYRKHHSTETALLKVKNDLLMAMNRQHVSLLVLLDLSSAFDTLDHQILLNTLQAKFGIQGNALTCSVLICQTDLRGCQSMVNFLNNLTLSGVCHRALVLALCCLFCIYTSRLFDIIQTHLPDVHCYADDTQLYLSFCPNAVENQVSALSAMEGCIHDVRTWMHSNGLMLNDKTIEGNRVGESVVTPVSIARNLGALFDASMTMESHVTKTCGTAFYFLHNIRRIRKYLSRECTETFIHAFISSRLDYCMEVITVIVSFMDYPTVRLISFMC